MADKLPAPPRAFPQAEFLREGPNGLLWFVPSGRDSRYGHVYCDPPSGELRTAGGSGLDAPRRPKLVHNRKGGSMAAATKSRKPSKSSAPKKSPSWKELPDAEKAAYLLERTTIPDVAHTTKKRHKDESRSDFIRRIYAVAE